MNKNSMLQDEIIVNKIYTIRGQKVMLDRDLAEMYSVETRRLNEQVKRNEKRFPIDFMFQLTEQELENWKSQFATSNKERMGLRKLPNVFTEQGVDMLSSILNSETAITVNIQIIRIFTRLREMLLNHKDVLLKFEQMDKKILGIGYDLKMHDGEIESIFSLIDEWRKEREDEKAKLMAPKNPIGFKTKSSKK